MLFKIFNSDVKRLLLMEDMWKNRAPPKPLDFDVALNSEEYKTVSGNSGSSIKDQRSLTLGDNVKLFIERLDYIVLLIEIFNLIRAKLASNDLHNVQKKRMNLSNSIKMIKILLNL